MKKVAGHHACDLKRQAGDVKLPGSREQAGSVKVLGFQDQAGNVKVPGPRTHLTDFTNLQVSFLNDNVQTNLQSSSGCHVV